MKKILFGIGTLATLSPLAVAISCGGVKSHIVTKEVQQHIDQALKSLNDPLGNLTVGRKLTPISSVDINKAITKVSNNVSLDKIILEKSTNPATTWQPAASSEVIQQNMTYKIAYSLKLDSKSAWEDGARVHLKFLMVLKWRLLKLKLH